MTLEVRMSKNGMPLWREAHCEMNVLKNLNASEHFESRDVAKSARATAR